MCTMENKKNFYAQYNTIYADLEKKQERVRVITTAKRELPFPNMPFIDDITNNRVKDLILNISNNDEMFFVGLGANGDSDNIGGYKKYGCVCKVECVNVSERNVNYICNVLYRSEIVAVDKEKDGDYVTCVPIDEVNTDTEVARMLLDKAKEGFVEYTSMSHKSISKDLINYIKDSTDCNLVINIVAVATCFSVEQQYKLLSIGNTEERLEDLIVFLRGKIEMEGISRKIDDKIREENDKRHKEAYIKETIKYLNEELGEDDDDLGEYVKKIKTSGMNEENMELAIAEVNKLRKTASVSADYGVMRAHLDTILELPWQKSENPVVDLARAKEVLEEDHYGLDKVKNRILEYLAVLKLNGGMNGQILCLAGAPGVGKTSIVKSIAKALDRKYVKLTLGGVSDESEIRGHRKTYVGAMMGKILSSIKNVGVNNPVFLLDEIDKMTKGNHGDPTSALLEVLDKEQNSSFRDNYVELPYDLSNVIFIATANDKKAIPEPLFDRMEVIDVDSYTTNDKFNIAKKYLIKKQAIECGLMPSDIQIDDDVLYDIIDRYTYEAGVRSLDRLIGKLCRCVAVCKVMGEEVPKISIDNISKILDRAPVPKEKRPMVDTIGVANGLAWSPYGGHLLMAESVTMAGSGKLMTTGNLMSVMKESSQIAFTVAKLRAIRDGVSAETIKNTDVYLNACEGGIKKDGPSAGGVMCLCMYSALTNKKVRCDYAMTGEINLSGDITAIGGLREKLYACVQNGIKNVLLPKENMDDVAFVSNDIKDKLNIVFVENIDDIIKLCVVQDDN